MSIDYQPMDIYELNDNFERSIRSIADQVEGVERNIPFFVIVPMDDDEKAVMALVPQLGMLLDEADQVKMMRYFGMRFGLDSFAIAYIGLLVESTRWEKKSVYEKQDPEDGIDCVIFAAMSVDSKTALHVMDVGEWDGTSREITNEITIPFGEESEDFIVSKNALQLENFMQGYILARMAKDNPAARARIENVSGGTHVARSMEEVKRILDDLKREE